MFAYGGAERVTEVIAHDVLPDAVVYCLAGNDQVCARMEISNRCRFILPRGVVTANNYRQLAPFYGPVLPRLQPIDGNLLSSSYALCHHLRCTGDHYCYCHSPLRQAWDQTDRYAAVAGTAERYVLRLGAAWLRVLDRRALPHVDRFVASSRAVRSRIQRYYGVQDVPIVPPPVTLPRVEKVLAGERQDYFLWVGRIVEPYKRVSLLLETFRGRPHEKLIIAGGGRDAVAIQQSAPRNVSFVGEVTGERLIKLYSCAKAVLFPSEDDFGIVPLEAMACGTPVVAYRGGGALDTVVEDETGVFFSEATPLAVGRAIDEVRQIDWECAILRARAAQFSREQFAVRLAALL